MAPLAPLWRPAIRLPMIAPASLPNIVFSREKCLGWTSAGRQKWFRRRRCPSQLVRFAKSWLARPAKRSQNSVDQQFSAVLRDWHGS
jgi:hypothetical protein